jgi:hypothetical protein
VIQNPQSLRKKLVQLANLQMAKTILYLGDDQNRLAELFKVLDGTREVHDNAIFMRAVMREAEALTKPEMAELEI